MKLFIAALSLALAGSVSAQSILDTVKDSPDHGTLEQAVGVAPKAIADALGNESLSLTLFAPDDMAFSALPEGTVGLLTTEPWENHLACVLLGHVHPNAVNSSSIPEGTTLVDSLTEGYKLNLTRSGEAVSVNGIPVTTADIPATNGFIHSISESVLLPDCVTKNIAELATMNGNFTTLLKLVGDANLTDEFTGAPTADGLTLMAPTDDAFSKVPSNILEFIGGNVTVLTEVLTYHAIPENVFPTESGSVKSIQGDDIMVDVDGSTIKLNGASTVQGTAYASNGVIHIIDTVLLPPSLSLPGTPMPTDGPETPMPTDAPSGAAKAGMLAAAVAGVAALIL